ncbi:unnamed protein product [Heligmosomoides polygyrus]|uniref:DUF7083 domain-containing protein n=1 Tax=Heligmosomoides polygyrus TaxID=6339 RepID=A0A183G4A9_HELPZ|nr:unnamed protein product [Heligmosomoides polygyrus]
MEALSAILEAVQQQLDVQGAALQQLMEKLCAVSTNSSSAGAAVVLRDKHAIFDFLYRRIETFNYDLDRGRTFDSWLRRYQDLFDNECIELDEKDKTRLLVSRLDEDCHRMLTSAISPKQPSDLPCEEVVQVLNRLFGTAKTLFRRRFECFKVRYEGQDFNNYETMVKAECTDAHFDSIDFDGLQCLFCVAGLEGSEFADYRTRLLRMLDQAENITLKDLTAGCQLIKSYKDDARLLEGTPAVNVVRRQKFQLGKKRKPQRRQ